MMAIEYSAPKAKAKAKRARTKKSSGGAKKPRKPRPYKPKQYGATCPEGSRFVCRPSKYSWKGKGKARG